MPSADTRRRWTQQKQFFLEKGHYFQVFLRNRERDETQVKTRIEKPGHDLFGNAHKDLNLRVGKLFPQQAEWTAEPVDQACDSSGEVKRTSIRRGVVLEIVPHLVRLLNERSGALGKAGRGGSRNQASARSHEQLRLELAGRSEERRVGKECRSRWSPYP